MSTAPAVVTRPAASPVAMTAIKARQRLVAIVIGAPPEKIILYPADPQTGASPGEVEPVQAIEIDVGGRL